MSNVDNYQEMIKRMIDYLNSLSNSDSIQPSINDFHLVVARLMRLKEKYITKEMQGVNNYKLKFDVFEAQNILRDLLFLCKYIIFLESKNEEHFDLFRDGLRDKAALVEIINTDHNTLSILESSSYFDDSLDTIITLKEMLIYAVCIFDSLRNSFGHNINGTQCELYFDTVDNTSKVSILNNISKNNLDVSVLYSYLLHFGKGIDVLQEHKHLLEEAELYCSEIFKIYNIKNVSGNTFRKKASLKRVAFLLTLFENDYDTFLKLPGIVFSDLVSEERIDFIKKHLEDEKKIKDLPSAIFMERCTEERIKNLGIIKNGFIDIDYLNKIPAIAFTCSDSSFDCFKHLFDEATDKDEFLRQCNLNVNDFRNKHNIYCKIFSVSLRKEALYFFFEECNGNQKALAKIPGVFVSTSCYFTRVEEIYKIIMGESKASDNDTLFDKFCQFPSVYLNENFSSYVWDLIKNKSMELFGNYYELFYLLPDELFRSKFYYNRGNIDKLFKTYFSLERFSKEEIIDRIKSFDSHMFFMDCDGPIFQYIVDNFSPDMWGKLPDIFFGLVNLEKIKTFAGAKGGIKRLLDLGVSKDKLNNIYNDALDIKFFKYLFDIPLENDADILEAIYDSDTYLNIFIQLPNRLYRFDYSHLDDYINKTDVSYDWQKIKIILGNDKRSGLNKLVSINPNVFFSDYSTENLEKLLNSNYSYILNKDNSEKYSKLLSYCLRRDINVKRLEIFGVLDDNGFNEDKMYYLDKVPIEVFKNNCSDEYFEMLLNNLGSLENFCLLSVNCFREDCHEIVEFFINNNCNILDIPEVCLMSYCTFDRVKTLYNRVHNNFDIFKKLPYELFVCDSLKLEEYFILYNENSSAIDNSFNDHIFDMSPQTLDIISFCVFFLSTVDLSSPLMDYNDFSLQDFSFNISANHECSKVLTEMLRILNNNSYFNSDIFYFNSIFKGCSNDDDYKKRLEEKKKEFDNLFRNYNSMINQNCIRSIRNSFEHMRTNEQDNSSVHLSDGAYRDEIFVSNFSFNINTDKLKDFIIYFMNYYLSCLNNSSDLKRNDSLDSTNTISDLFRMYSQCHINYSDGISMNENQFMELCNTFVDRKNRYFEYLEKAMIVYCVLKDNVNVKFVRFNDDIPIIGFMINGKMVMISCLVLYEIMELINKGTELTYDMFKDKINLDTFEKITQDLNIYIDSKGKFFSKNKSDDVSYPKK